MNGEVFILYSEERADGRDETTLYRVRPARIFLASSPDGDAPWVMEARDMATGKHRHFLMHRILNWSMRLALPPADDKA